MADRYRLRKGKTHNVNEMDGSVRSLGPDEEIELTPGQAAAWADKFVKVGSAADRAIQTEQEIADEELPDDTTTDDDTDEDEDLDDADIDDEPENDDEEDEPEDEEKPKDATKKKTAPTRKTKSATTAKKSHKSHRR